MPAFAFLALVRIVSGLAIVLVATYYLLASIPFAYYHFLQFPLFWWMPLFMRTHPLLMLLGTAGLVATMRDAPTPWRPWVRYIGIAGVTISAAMFASSLVPGLQSDETASALYMAPMLLMSVAGALDLVAHASHNSTRLLSSGIGGRGLVASAALAGGLTATIYLSVATLSRGDAGGLLSSEILIIGGATLLGHVGMFLLVMGALTAIQLIARRGRWTALLETLVLGGLVATLVGAAMRRTLLVTLPLSEGRAVTLAALMGIGLTLHWQALMLRRRSPSDRDDMIRHVLLPIPGTSTGRALAAVACLIVMAAAIGILPRLMVVTDWGSAIQKLLVFAAWLASLGLVLSLPDRPAIRARFGVGIALAMTLILATAAAKASTNRPLGEAHRAFDVETAVDRYATLDTSAMALLDLVRPVMVDKGFFDTLFFEGDRTYWPSVRATPLRLVADMRSTQAYRPHIFLIVIDSLRPDYLGTYNPDATFTPNIDAFARESVVMRNAFAPYAGTALSQPSIWAGGLIQRHQYVKPFGIVNNLERLISSAGYRKYITMDAILKSLLEDRTNLTPLDTAIHPERREDEFKFELCTTLGELKSDLDRDAANPAPVFFYSQAQSLHIGLLSRMPTGWVRTRPGSREFYEPATIVLKRLDACLGDFIGYLKAKHMYDDSIVILTSDHGDAYGESNIFGHAFHVRPEIVKVPIIMHVPERLLAGRRSDPEAVTLLTDITPTLYTLLGYGPLSRQPLLGQPFLTTADSRLERRDTYFLESSYGRVFGVLLNHGTRLYSVNANTLTEELYDFGDGWRVQRSPAPADRVVYRRWLLEQLEVLNSYYAPKQIPTH